MAMFFHPGAPWIPGQQGSHLVGGCLPRAMPLVQGALWDSSRPQTLFQKGLGQQLWKAAKIHPPESVSFSHSWDAVGRWHPLASPRTKTA